MKKSVSLLEKGILHFKDIQRIINYIKERECKKGGYCFYQQEEPNSSDTFYAISVQNMLNNDLGDQERTISLLKNLQNNNGSYFSIIQAYYTIKALLELKRNPLKSPNQFILDNLLEYRLRNLPAGVSIYRKMYYLINLANMLKIPLSIDLKENIIDFVKMRHNEDKGFGNSNKSTLIETMQALHILNWVEFPINSINETEAFISKCYSPIFSFTNIPQISPSFIEHVNAGLIALKILTIKPPFLKESINFIKGCQTTRGGFSRIPHTGIATLENTYYAVNSLHLISQIM